MARHRKRPPASLEPGGYEVGYKKPPAVTRWRKGHSGNPRGRPPKEEPDLIGEALALMEAMSRTSVAASGPYGEIQVEMLEGIVQRMLIDAMNESKSGGKFLTLYAKLRGAQSLKTSPDDHDDDEAQLARFEQRLAKRLADQPPKDDDNDHDD